nr:hypothetical protein [Planctomycetota bacterium]
DRGMVAVAGGLASAHAAALARGVGGALSLTDYYTVGDDSFGRGFALAVSPDGATPSRIVLAVKDLLLAPADGCGDAKNVLQMLWPQVEIGIDSRPRVQVEALDASRQVIDASRDFATLPITRELGHLLREKNARLWVIVATLAAGLALVVIGRRS